MASFPRRRNKDGSIDSICPKCFRTIASRTAEDHLVEEEKRHSCAIRDLHHVEAHKSKPRMEHRPTK
jgi:hypothetical protein